MTVRGRTVEELAAVTRRDPDLLRQLLQEEQRRGLVEERDGRWHASEYARREFDLIRHITRPREGER